MAAASSVSSSRSPESLRVVGSWSEVAARVRVDWNRHSSPQQARRAGRWSIEFRGQFLSRRVAPSLAGRTLYGFAWLLRPAPAPALARARSSALWSPLLPSPARPAATVAPAHPAPATAGARREASAALQAALRTADVRPAARGGKLRPRAALRKMAERRRTAGLNSRAALPRAVARHRKVGPRMAALRAQAHPTCRWKPTSLHRPNR
jgi:hypothetical protein